MADDTPTSTQRSADLVLARLHLRLGSLALARAELETLAGRDELDAEGVVDLAEARWRTGDLTGAGEAAALVIDDDDGPVLALIVAAEAAAARGRPTEARRLASKALATADGSIDTIFAGMPRSPVWPPDPAAPPAVPTTMFEPHGPTRRSGADRRRHPREAAPVPPTAPAAASAGTIGIWDDAGDDPSAAGDDSLGVDDASMPSGDEALERGRAEIEAGDIGAAAVQLALVLRLSPALAPAVLDLVGSNHEPGLALLRGDAYRLVGRELDARRAYADAARHDPTAPAESSGEPTSDSQTDDPTQPQGDSA
jgi:tetratricopeptide (TPR) repeat protein